jgi:hypothetical protein
MKFYVLRLVDWLPLLPLISGDNNFTDALSGYNNFICRSSAR